MHCSRGRCPSLGHRAPQITPGSAMKISLPQCSWESLFSAVRCGQGVLELKPATGYFTGKKALGCFVLVCFFLFFKLFIYLFWRFTPMVSHFTKSPGNLNTPELFRPVVQKHRQMLTPASQWMSDKQNKTKHRKEGKKTNLTVIIVWNSP